jgi:hypothetical protein
MQPSFILDEKIFLSVRQENPDLGTPVYSPIQEDMNKISGLHMRCFYIK